MISKYLKELIESNNRIIIPDLGAFMIQDSPKGKQITFNDFLKFNDGLLINQIIRNEQISKSDAADKIKEFTKEVEKSFAAGKPYAIEGVGQLLKDSHNNIIFESKIGGAAIKTKTSVTDVKPTIVLDEKSKQQEKVTAKKRVQASKPKQEKKSEAKPKVEPAKVVPTKAPVTHKPKVESVVAAQSKSEVKTTSTKTVSKPIEKKKTVAETQGSKDTILNTIIIIVAAVIVLGGGTWAVINFNIISIFDKTEVPVHSVVEVVEPIIVADAVVVDTVVADVVVEQPVVIEEPIEDNRTKYFLIGGSFKVVLNAESFNQKLIEEGFDSEIVIGKNGFHCVSYKHVYSWSEVVAEWRQMKNTYPKIWILIE